MTNKTPETFLKQWMDAVNNGDIDTLLNLYADNAILIPTFSNRILKTAADRQEYFERLATRDDLSVALHEKTLVEQLVNGPIATLSGIYCWRFAIDGQLLNFEARFSYVFDMDSANPIIHHHSSQIPRML
jgi:hypothetical protein